ncbi:DNA polymerase III subunit alpha [Vibrio coralliilyticus]|jgi:DNA polymerase-3 subunit alpha|uniref:DNA polymerase III subunit alpha n=1 Tax=Vibrio coralliilyticus TaxID=190893 RepID=UPI000390E550|nr:DNA polymerase III subunit alpha [Vibrio coralliilyticus]ERB65381.1 DNA polymerase III subunit alpha [Vibrio coralliilyticus OCN008]NOI29014.1 DNA polymerase III subunit alpha [Vibrio coralliilyticus]NOI48073.1 DNA polymerase III subunit alpha [Vibrio coralliilyticus]NOI78657.1 DNA polymerase III subunit alpha [Vibrio coralliilyticus]PAW01090.1 DNA polymerase III subunit alpha [Vibrio coralliilyticus]
MSDPKFIHLKVHSDFSMVDGLSKVPPLVKKVAEMGMPAMALTDFTNLCGLVKFYGTAHGCGVKPIIGADFAMQSEEFGEELTKLTVLAADNEGYKNLTLLISKAYLRGHVQHQPVIDKQWLAELSAGLIVLSGAKSGEIGKALLKGNHKVAQNCADFYHQHFADRFFLELTRTGRADEETYLHFALDFAEKEQLPVVATNDVVILDETTFEAHEIRVAIHDGYTLEDPRRPKNYSAQQYLRSEEEMCELFADIPEALENSVEIAKRCNVTVRLGEYFLPAFPTEGMEETEFLVKKSEEGLEERLEFLFPDEEERAKRRPEYDERLKVELEVINNMGFPGYFLIVMEFIQWSKDNDIPVGPGRGSGAGSLVAYALKITDLDPLEYDLLFERFLNPERVSMPDFDVDFCMDKRDQVIDHVAEMYGRDAVSQIITFGTMAAKAVIRDVGRVLGHPFGFVDRISKLVPPDPGMTLEKAFKAEPALPELYEADEEVKELIDMCRILEGCTRNAGKHAGGVVISPTTITDFAPIYADAEGHFPVTQFDKNDVETAGLVKFDFLGLRTLTIIDWALGLINPRLEREGKAPVRIESIPLDDAASFRLLQNSETTAVFQLESRGMKELIKRLQPDCFEDIIALVALFRPGPLQSGMVDNFIDRKHGREAISYPDEKWQHESLKEILDPTYGIILYQEQVMQIAQVLSGYTLGGADMLRRAMGKKKPEEMAKQRATFEDGAVKNGVDGELAMKIFDLVEKFAGYGFNKSHSAAYALVSYQTLWLKMHYPAEFMAAVMTADMDNTEKVVGLVDECFRMKLKVLPPDINAGLYRFNVDENGAIVYGIGAIKGVGEGPIEAILEARNKGGHFKDLFDFCARIDLKKVNKRVIEKLIYAGALDRLGPHRAAMMASLNDAVKAASQYHQAEAFGQSDLFGVLTEAPEEVEHKYTKVPAWPEKVWLEGERDTLGLYLTGHPINAYIKELGKYTSCRLKDATPTRRDQSVTVAGLVIAARVMTTKRGTRIGIMTLDDRSGRMEVMLFSDALDRYAELLEQDKILVVSGQVSFDDFNGGLKMSAREVMDLGTAREKYARGLSVSIEQSQIDDQFFERFSKILEPYKAGTVPVHIYYQRSDARARLTLGTEWRVTPSDELIDNLKQLLGKSQVELEFN